MWPIIIMLLLLLEFSIPRCRPIDVKLPFTDYSEPITTLLSVPECSQDDYLNDLMVVSNSFFHFQS